MDGDVGAKDKGVVAVDLSLHIKIDALIRGPGDGCGGIGDGVGAVGEAGNELFDEALLVEGDVGEVVEVAAVGFDLRSPVVVVVDAACPYGSDSGAALVSGCAGAAAAASAAAGGTQDVLDGKVLLVDVVALAEGGDAESCQNGGS